MPRVDHNQCPVCGKTGVPFISMVVQECPTCKWNSKMPIEQMQEMRMQMIMDLAFPAAMESTGIAEITDTPEGRRVRGFVRVKAASSSALGPIKPEESSPKEDNIDDSGSLLGTD